MEIFKVEIIKMKVPNNVKFTDISKKKFWEIIGIENVWKTTESKFQKTIG